MFREKIPHTPENYEYLYDNYSKDIASFAIDIFLSPGPDVWQSTLWADFYNDQKNAFYARPSGHSTGKSFAAAITMLHFLLFHPDVGIVATANTRQQLLNKLGREIQVQINRSLITDWFEPTATKIYRKKFDGRPDTTAFIELATNNESSVEAFSGLHAEAVLFVADECSALDPGIHQAILSSTPKQTPHAIRRVMYFGNPLRSQGVFYDVCKNPKISKYWDIEHLNALDCKYSDKEYLQMLIDSYGYDSNIVKTRVLGQFPDTSADALISSRAIEEAALCELSKADYARDPVIMAVDVARHGDDVSVIVIRQGRNFEILTEIQENTVPSLARAVVEEYRRSYPRPEVIIVDSIGIGAGVFDILEEWNLPVLEFIGNAAPFDRTFNNLRSETYWKCKQWIEVDKPSIPNNQLLLDELRAYTYDYDTQLRIRVARKEDVKKELDRSPDRADGLMMTFYSDNKSLFRRRGKALPIKKSRYAW